MSFSNFQITQNIIIPNQNDEVLILKHNSSKWLLPGGRINVNENWKDALEREVDEETGIKEFEIERIIDTDNWYENGNGFYVVTYLSKKVKVDQVILSDEHVEFSWVSLSNLDSFNFWHQNIKERIKKVFN